jgi:anti-sigma B factor antagonist
VKDLRPLGLRCLVEPDRERVVVRPIGEIDLATVGLVEAPLRELRTTGFDEVVLDLCQVPFMDSSGLRLVIQQTRLAEQDGKALRIEIAEGGAVHRLLEVTAMLDHLQVTVVGPGSLNSVEPG